MLVTAAGGGGGGDAAKAAAAAAAAAAGPHCGLGRAAIAPGLMGERMGRRFVSRELATEAGGGGPGRREVTVAGGALGVGVSGSGTVSAWGGLGALVAPALFRLLLPEPLLCCRHGGSTIGSWCWCCCCCCCWCWGWCWGCCVWGWPSVQLAEEDAAEAAAAPLYGAGGSGGDADGDMRPPDTAVPPMLRRLALWRLDWRLGLLMAAAAAAAYCARAEGPAAAAEEEAPGGAGGMEVEGVPRRGEAMGDADLLILRLTAGESGEGITQGVRDCVEVGFRAGGLRNR